MVKFFVVALSVTALSFLSGSRSFAAGGGDAYAADNFGASVLIGVPHPLNVTGEWRVNPKTSVALSGGALSIPYTDLTTQYNFGITNADVRGRWHPFSGAFFLGAALGLQWLNGSAKDSLDAGGIAVPTTVSVRIRSLYMTPHLGWLWAWKGGFMIGIEAGVQLPFAPSTTIDVTSDDAQFNNLLALVKQGAQYKKLDSDLQNIGDKFGKLTFPYVGLLRIGWSF